jgi:Right handed beta helix region
MAIALGAALLWPGAAHAAGPRCGDTVTADVTLTRALRCTGDALTVASGVTLDLGGHTLYGGGAGTGIAVQSAATVRHGRVLGFETGVWVGDGDRTLEDLTVAHNARGIVADGAGAKHPLEIRRSLVTANDGDGLYVQFAPVEIGDSRFLRNGGAGVRAVRAEPASFEGSAFSGNGGDGLQITGGISRISASSASRNGGSGIVVDDSLRTFFAYSLATNQANGNASLGIWFKGMPFDPLSGLGVDLGGNRATLNGDRRQCVQIACTRR